MSSNHSQQIVQKLYLPGRSQRTSTAVEVSTLLATRPAVWRVPRQRGPIRLWNYCNILRDDGLSYGAYVEQLTFLLFLKMADDGVRGAHIHMYDTIAS